MSAAATTARADMRFTLRVVGQGFGQEFSKEIRLRIWQSIPVLFSLDSSVLLVLLFQLLLHVLKALFNLASDSFL